MIETLFGDNGGQNQDTPNSPRPNQPTVRIEQRTMDMTVEGAPVKLTVVDTPGAAAHTLNLAVGRSRLRCSLVGGLRCRLDSVPPFDY